MAYEPTSPGNVFVLRAASGDLTAAETTTAVAMIGINAGIYMNVMKLTTPDADDEVDFYIQTTYDGTNWFDLSCLHFATADNGNTPKHIFVFGPPSVLASSVSVLATDGTLTDNTKVLAPLGTHIRIKTKVTGATAPTYAYSCTGYFY
jgi:hypothetical protein